MGCFLDYENQSPIDMINMEKRCKILDTGRKDANIQIGKRLREARLNMNLEKSEIADVLDVTVEHYRKLEAGITCIFRKNRALAPHERSAVPLGTDHCPVG